MVVDLFPKYLWRQKEKQYILSCFPEQRIRLDEEEYRLMADLMERAGVSVPIIGRAEEKQITFQNPLEMSECLERLLKQMDEWEVLPAHDVDGVLNSCSARTRQIVKKALITVYEYSRNGYYAAIRP